ncbi:hypothetical protein Cni_G06357 [Canna indica]|uniref:ATPase AAA-type core domain-containing protein n=1 Tax=Canna indica TaxID=4628 RepID=A0AAQ3JYJ4_9LILI|nr:hypothetical protein Cni_G06357 [Canna indica]
MGSHGRKPKENKEDEGEDKLKPPLETEDKEEIKVTLSGLLNCIDELWSACGGERLIIFTTNHMEKLDPALIRRGWMDKRVEMSYCCFEAFKVLAKNYLGIGAHELFDEVQRRMTGVEITPTDVAMNLMLKSKEDDVGLCLWSLIPVLEEAKEAARTGGCGGEGQRQ